MTGTRQIYFLQLGRYLGQEDTNIKQMKKTTKTKISALDETQKVFAL